MGGKVIDLDTGEVIGREQLLERLESSDFGSKVIPPYVAAKSLADARRIAHEVALDAAPLTSDGSLPFG
ncbi:MAG TPA: hypothetical protein VF228_13525 [Iamia sp.]